MANNTGRLTRVAWKKESVWGTAVTCDQQLSVKSTSLVNKIENVEDPRNIGLLFTSDMVKVGETPGGSIDLSVHPLEIGPITNACLGKNDAPTTSPTARLLIYYTGVDAYADIVVTNGGSASIVGSSGATAGTKVAAFTLDTSLTPNNTMAKLVALINAATGWKCYLFGTGSIASSTIPALSLTVLKGNGPLNSAILATPSGSSSSKLHHVYSAGATDTWPSYTVVIDKTLGASQAVQYDGCKADSLTLKLTAAQMTEASLALSARKETAGITFPAVTIPTDTAYVAGKSRVFLNGIESGNDKDLTLTISPTMDKSHVVGSDYIQEQMPTAATCKISGTLNLEITDYLLKYTDYTSMLPEEFVIYMENSGWADQTNNVQFSALYKLSSFKWNKYEAAISGPNRLTVSFEGTTVYQGASINAIDAYIVDTNVSAY